MRILNWLAQARDQVKLAVPRRPVIMMKAKLWFSKVVEIVTS
jgi:hypothetical protein